MEYDKDIRSYLDMMEFHSFEEAPIALPEAEPEVSIDLPQRLADIVFKLRSYSEPTGGEFALGFEQGLEMAAAMIDGLIDTMGGHSGS